LLVNTNLDQLLLVLHLFIRNLQRLLRLKVICYLYILLDERIWQLGYFLFTWFWLILKLSCLLLLNRLRLGLIEINVADTYVFEYYLYCN